MKIKKPESNIEDRKAGSKNIRMLKNMTEECKQSIESWMNGEQND